MNTIKLTPAPTSERVRIGLGLKLVTEDGLAVQGFVTPQDYGQIASLDDGTVGVLRREWTGRGYVYSLEAGEAEQDWENETTTWTLADGRKVQCCGEGMRTL